MQWNSSPARLFFWSSDAGLKYTMIFYYLMLFLAPFMEYPHLPKIGTFTVIKLVGILVMVVAVIKAGATARPLFLLRFAEAKLFIFLLSIITLSALSLGFPYTASLVVQTYISFFIFLFTTLVLVDSIEKLKKSCVVVLFSMFIASLYVYNSYIRWGSTRPGGIVGDSNYYAMIAISILPMAMLLQGSYRGLMRLFIIGTAFSLAASTLLGGSRAGFLGICLSAVYLVMHMQRRVLVLSAGASVLAILLVVLPVSPLERLLNPKKDATSSSEIRSRIIVAGFEMIRDYPLTGVGIGQFKPMSVKYTPEYATRNGRPTRWDGHIAHNTYLNLAAELGIIGLLTFVSIIFSSWRRARKLAKWGASQSPPVEAAVQLGRAIEAGLVGYAFTAIFLTADYIKHAWILMFFGLALNRIILLEYARTATANRPAPVPSRAPVPASRRVPVG